jgi:hypothetical protein
MSNGIYFKIIITRVSSFKIVSGDTVHQPTWPLLLKIEHMVKLQVFGNNSKTVFEKVYDVRRTTTTDAK